MSEYKVGDKIYFQGNQGEIIRVTQDENEPLLEVALTQTRVTYLNPSQLDLYPFAEQLNENQQIVLGYLKEMMISFDLCNAIYRLESAEDWGHASEPYDIAYESLNDKERLQVVQAACQWAQEWEEPV